MASWLSHPLLRRKIAGTDQNITFVKPKMPSRELLETLDAEFGLTIHPDVSNRMVCGQKGAFPTGLKSIPADTTLDYDAFHEKYPSDPLERLRPGHSSQDAPIQKLPTELLLSIFGMLNLPSVDSARFACKDWYALIMSDELLLHKLVCPGAEKMYTDLRGHASYFEKQTWKFSNVQTPKMRHRQCDIVFACPEPGQKTVLVAMTNSCTLIAMVVLGKNGYAMLVYHLNSTGRPCLVKGVALQTKPTELNIKNNPAAQFGSIVTVVYEEKVEHFEVVQRMTIRRVDKQWTSIFDLYRSTQGQTPRALQQEGEKFDDWTLMKHLSLEKIQLVDQDAYRERPFHIAKHKNGRLYLVQLSHKPQPSIKPLVLISAPYEDAEIINIAIESHQELVARHLQVAIIWRGQSSPFAPAQNTLFIYEIDCPRRYDWSSPQNGPLMRFPDCWKIGLDGNYTGFLPLAMEKNRADLHAEIRQRGGNKQYDSWRKTLEEAKRCCISYGHRASSVPIGFGGQWEPSRTQIVKDELEKVDIASYQSMKRVKAGFSVFDDEKSTLSGMRLFCNGHHLALWGLTNDGGLRLRLIQLQSLHRSNAYTPQWELGHETNCGCALHDYGWLAVHPVLQHPFPSISSSKGFFSKTDERSIPDAKIKAEEVQYLVSQERLAAIKRVEAAVLASAVEKRAKMEAIKNDHVEGPFSRDAVVPPSLLALSGRTLSGQSLSWGSGASISDSQFLNVRREFRRVYEAITRNRSSD